VDEIRLLSHWMYLRRDDLVHVRWTPDQPVRTLTSRVLQALRHTPSAAAA